MFNNLVIANFPQNVPVKEFWKSVNIWRSYGQWQSGTFLETQLDSNLMGINTVESFGLYTCVCFANCVFSKDVGEGDMRAACWKGAVRRFPWPMVLRPAAQTLLRIYLRRLRWKRQQLRFASIVHGILRTLARPDDPVCCDRTPYSTLSRFIFTLRPHAGPDSGYHHHLFAIIKYVI